MAGMIPARSEPQQAASREKDVTLSIGAKACGTRRIAEKRAGAGCVDRASDDRFLVLAGSLRDCAQDECRPVSSRSMPMRAESPGCERGHRVYAVRSGIRPKRSALPRAKTDRRYHQRRQSGRQPTPMSVVDPDRPYPARDDERNRRILPNCCCARPEPNMRLSGKSHRFASFIVLESARHALGVVRNGYILPTPRMLRSFRHHAHWPAARRTQHRQRDPGIISRGGLSFALIRFPQDW